MFYRSQLHKRLIDMGVLQHIEYNEVCVCAFTLNRAHVNTLM